MSNVFFTNHLCLEIGQFMVQRSQNTTVLWVGIALGLKTAGVLAFLCRLLRYPTVGN